MRATNRLVLSIASLGTLLFAAAPVSTQADSYPVRMATSLRTSAVRADPSFIDTMLREHNAERAKWRLPALQWNAALARDAQVWADHMARTGEFEHDYDSDAAERQGENLWMGTKGAWSYAEMVEGWTAERKYYRSGVFPAVSRTANWEDVGHYTQLIWKDTRQVGCAVAHDRESDYLVCRYDPPGNFEGEIAERGRMGGDVQLAYNAIGDDDGGQ